MTIFNVIINQIVDSSLRIRISQREAALLLGGCDNDNEASKIKRHNDDKSSQNLYPKYPSYSSSSCYMFKICILSLLLASTPVITLARREGEMNKSSRKVVPSSSIRYVSQAFQQINITTNSTSLNISASTRQTNKPSSVRFEQPQPTNHSSTPSPSLLPSWISSQPTLFTSNIPSQKPSWMSPTPSIIPSTIPSTHPSMILSTTPSIIPSTIPSTHPSMMPSTTPSTHPSMILSTTPSIIPSTIPSMHPSMIPSTTPSTHPSMIPSTTPSTHPSISSTPSSIPTFLPSLYPSVLPTISIIPSSTPTFIPSAFPSNMPSVSFLPTTPRPTISHSPTKFPTLTPTAYPSESPSTSFHPTSFPSQEPTLTSSPTLRPTNQNAFSVQKVFLQTFLRKDLSEFDSEQVKDFQDLYKEYTKEYEVNVGDTRDISTTCEIKQQDIVRAPTPRPMALIDPELSPNDNEETLGDGRFLQQDFRYELTIIYEMTYESKYQEIGATIGLYPDNFMSWMNNSTTQARARVESNLKQRNMLVANVSSVEVYLLHEPSISPSSSPSTSSKPSTFPSMDPSELPSKTPSISEPPTIFPTLYPSAYTTNVPSGISSSAPSEGSSKLSPTQTPSIATVPNNKMIIIAAAAGSGGFLIFMAGILAYRRKSNGGYGNGNSDSYNNNVMKVPIQNEASSSNIPGDIHKNPSIQYQDSGISGSFPGSPGGMSLVSNPSMIVFSDAESVSETGHSLIDTEFKEIREIIESGRLNIKETAERTRTLLTRDIDLSTQPHVDGIWGDNTDPMEIEATALCELFDWKKKRQGALEKERQDYMKDFLQKMVASVRNGVIEPEHASLITHECCAILGLPLEESLPKKTLIVTGMQKTAEAINLSETFTEFGEIEGAAVAKRARGFGVVRYKNSKSVNRALEKFRHEEIVVQDVAVVVKLLEAETDKKNESRTEKNADIRLDNPFLQHVPANTGLEAHNDSGSSDNTQNMLNMDILDFEGRS